MSDINNLNNETSQNDALFTQYPDVQPVPPSKKPPKKRKPHTTAKVALMLAGVIAVGGGAGFGGAYFANSAQMSAVVDTSRPDRPNSPNSGSKDNTSGKNSTPTLDALQKDVGVAGVVPADTSGIEYNTDGTYMYTRDLVASVRDSVVYIETFVESRGRKTAYASASGIIISKDGYIVTNHHVVSGSTSYTVKVNTTDPETGISESKTYDATLCGSDEDTDLAVLKIDGVDELPAAKLGDSDKLRLGDDVIVIGNPLGFETSISKGIISGLNRQVDSDRHALTSIQTDAPINSGNSGGALFNTYGEVIGVVNEKLVAGYAENMGFAITINEAKDVIEDLISQGYISGRSMLGITTLSISETYAAYTGETAGWRVAEIKPDFPVANSGLLVGDTIIRIDGISVFDSEVTNIFYEKDPGETVTVTVVRTNSLGREKEVDIEVELAAYDGS